jgi:hypothetical protein
VTLSVPGAPGRRRRALLIIATAVVLLLTVICGFAYALGGFRQNAAKSAFQPIGHALESAGGHRVCDSGDAGYGPDNTAPWYDAIYRMPKKPALRARLVSIGADHGFTLTRRATTDDPTGVRLLQASSNKQTLTMSLFSGTSTPGCGSSRVSPSDGTEVLEVQFLLPSRTDGAIIPLAPEATQTPGTPQRPWYEQRFGMFTPFVDEGAGNSVVTLPPTATTGVLTVSHTGSGPFSIVALDSAGASTGELIVDTVGEYTGVVPFGLHGVGTVARSLTVTSVGAWSISFGPLSTVSTLTPPSSGSGDRVFRYDGRAGDWIITNSSPTEHTFEVRQYFGGGAVDSAYSGNGTFSGAGPVNAGPSIIVISSRGDWTLSRAP